MKNNLFTNGVTRRDFLQGCSYVAAAAILGGGCQNGKTKGYAPSDADGNNSGGADIDDDSYSFNIHPSADILDSVQTFVKFQTNKLDAVVESSQPMFMLSSPNVSHDGSFKSFTKTYGQPEILHLDNNADGNTYVEINTNSHKNNIGLVQERIKIGPSTKLERSNGLSYTYNDIVACNGSQHNTVNGNGKFISQKMAIVAINSKMGLGDDWNSIEACHDMMSTNGESTLLNGKQLQLIYQYDEVDSLHPSSTPINPDTTSVWKTIDMIDLFQNAYGTIYNFFEDYNIGWSPVNYMWGLSIEDISMYSNEEGKDFLYGTVSVDYFSNVGFIVTFDGLEPEIHWYMPEEMGFHLDEAGPDDVLKYNARYRLLSMLSQGNCAYVGPINPDLYVTVDVLLNDIVPTFGLEKWEKFLGKVIFKPLFVDDDHVIVRYQTQDRNSNDNVVDVTAFIKVPLKSRSDTEISVIETQDPASKVEVSSMVQWEGCSEGNESPLFFLYNPNLKNSAVASSTEFDNYYALMSPADNRKVFIYNEYIDGRGYTLRIRGAKYTSSPFVFSLSEPIYIENRASWDSQEASGEAWYVESGLIPNIGWPLSDYMGDGFNVQYSRNHAGMITMSIVPNDSTKLTFEWKLDENVLIEGGEIKPPQPMAYGVKRVLPWNNYLHESELLYEGVEQKNIAPIANGANAGSLRDLTHQSSNEEESYFYAFSDYLEKNWKLVELQNAPKDPPKKVASLHKVKQKIHQVTLVITDQNHNIVTLKENAHVEIRCNSGATVQDVTNPEKIKKVHLNRTTSYLAKDDGQGHVKLQIDVGHEGDMIAGLDLHYRIVDTQGKSLSAFASKTSGSPEKILELSDDSLTTQWASFNISYSQHDRLSKMSELQPTAPTGTTTVESKYSANIASDYSSESPKLITSTKKVYGIVANRTAPPSEQTAGSSSMVFLRNSPETHSPLYSVKILGSGMQIYSLNSFIDVIDDAANHLKAIENAAVKAAEAEIEKIKKAINKTIKNLENIVADLDKAVSSVLNAVEAFCDSVLKDVESMAKLLLALLKGLFDFKTAFEVGAGLKMLIKENFTLENSGIFGAIYKDIEGEKPALLDVVSKHKGKASQSSGHMGKIKTLPPEKQKVAANTTVANHKNATHNNHTKNQISQNVDFSGFSAVPSVESVYSANGCDDIPDDIKTIFEDIGSSTATITNDAQNGNFTKMGSDLEDVMKTVGSDIAKISEDLFKCVIEMIFEAFAKGVNDALNMPLPGFIKTMLNDIIVPLFGLGDNRFEVAADILFFILGFGINIVSTVGTAVMKPISDIAKEAAPTLDLKKMNISTFLKKDGGASDLAKRYEGLTGVSTSIDGTVDNFVTGTALLLHTMSNVMVIPTYYELQDFRNAEEEAEGFISYLERVEIMFYAVDVTISCLKSIAMLVDIANNPKSSSYQSEDSESLKNAAVFISMLANLLKMLPVNRENEGAVFVMSMLHFGGLLFGDALNIASYTLEDEAQNVEVLGLMAAIIDTIPDIIETGIAVQGEVGPIELLIALGGTLESATIADIVEFVEAITEE